MASAPRCVIDQTPVTPVTEPCCDGFGADQTTGDGSCDCEDRAGAGWSGLSRPGVGADHMGAADQAAAALTLGTGCGTGLAAWFGGCSDQTWLTPGTGGGGDPAAWAGADPSAGAGTV